jgi:guanine deaminase
MSRTGCWSSRDGLVKAAGEARELLRTLPADTEIVDHRPHLIMPGFIDAHIHMPQTQVVASYGAQLMEWLNKYTFVEEQKLAQQGHAEKLSRFFLDELLANGTTTAAVYCSVHPQSAEAFFTESQRRNTRMIAGKVMMDRNAPEALTDTAESGYRDSKALIARWHGRGRQLYAITPRFAITSTPEQMAAAGKLAAEHPDCHVQTHIDENRAEIALRLRALSGSRRLRRYLSRLRPARCQEPHGPLHHMTHNEWQAFAETGAVAVFCPTSNLFLGSGLFDWGPCKAAGRQGRGRHRYWRRHLLFDAQDHGRGLQGAAASRAKPVGF